MNELGKDEDDDNNGDENDGDIETLLLLQLMNHKETLCQG